jgi:hypothetical protein
MWHLDSTADDAGTSLVEEVDVAPAFLVSRFGPPLPGDGYRVTGRYIFTDGRGELFTVYDYKSTAAYLGDEEDALAPEDFWKTDSEQELSVGGRGSYRDGSGTRFVEWLLGQQAQWKSRRA